MKRNLGLWAIGIALWSGTIAQAQGLMPGPYPSAYGYPTYAAPGPIPMPYGQPLANPYGQPMRPVYGQPMPAQYGQPMPSPYGHPMRPTVPMLPAPGPNTPFTATDMAPGNATPFTKTVQTSPAPESLPSVPAGEPVTIYQGPSSGLPLEDEPVAVYEGKRYFSEMKLDNTRAWVQAKYIHWWVERPKAPPLVMSGNSVLLGGEISPEEFSGIEGQLGVWLDPEHMNSLEITGQFLGKNSTQYSFASNAAGNPALGIPLQLPTANGIVSISSPGVLSGNFNLNNIMNFYGAEANLTQNVLRINGWTLDYFGGGRFLYMNDNLSINQRRTALTPTALTFGGAAVPTGSSVLVSDSFNATNRFYGGDIGARVHWTSCRFDLGLSAKVALGATSYVTVVDGFSTLTSPTGASSTRTGGTFAQASNIGRITDTQFTAIPEIEAMVSYQLTSHIRVLGGYSFLYWNRVQRASDQLSGSLNPAQSPTSPTFNANATGSPIFPSARNEMLIQGVNVGLEFKY